MPEILGDAVNGIVFASEADSQFSTAAPVAEANAMLKKYYPAATPDRFTVMGYAHARLIVQALRSVGHDLTRDGLVNALESGKTFEVGTMAPMIFTPTDHNGPSAVRILQWEGGKPIARSDWIQLKK